MFPELYSGKKRNRRGKKKKKSERCSKNEEEKRNILFELQVTVATGREAIS